MPPQSVEAEQAVLGGLMLVRPEKLDDALAQCGPARVSSFYRRDHQLIWRAILHLHGKHRPVDAVTLGEWFESQGGLSEHVASGAYRSNWRSGSASGERAGLREIVAEMARRRSLIEIGTGS